MARILSFVLAIALVGGLAFLVMRGSLGAPAKAPPAPVQAPRAEFCEAQNAVYAYRGDARLTLRLETVRRPLDVPGSLSQVYAAGSLGSSLFVVKVADGRRFAFAGIGSLGYTTNYLFPVSDDGRISPLTGADLIQVSTFDSHFAYTPGLPVGTLAAPARIFAPNLARYLATHTEGATRIETAVSFFDFVLCDQPRATP